MTQHLHTGADWEPTALLEESGVPRLCRQSVTIYEEGFLSRSRPSILPPCPPRVLRIYTHTEMEGTGDAFGGAAGRIIRRPTMLRGQEEGEEDKGGLWVGGRGRYYTFVRAYTLPYVTNSFSSIRRVVKEAFNSR
jgi:hypothetical protein